MKTSIIFLALIFFSLPTVLAQQNKKPIKQEAKNPPGLSVPARAPLPPSDEEGDGGGGGTTPSYRNITYLHGLGASSASWEATKNVIASEFYVSSTNFSYPNTDPLQSVATSYISSIPTNSVVIGSSQGGLIPREMVRRFGTDRVSALITVGTPHRGAPIVNQVGNAPVLAGWWIGDLLLGPSTLLGWNYGYSVAQYYLNSITSFLSPVLTTMYNANNASTNDMKPNSSFLQTLNSNPAATMPAATYSIYGLEDWNTVWRLADSHFNNGGLETGAGIQLNVKLQTYWYYVSVYSFWISDYYLWLYDCYGDPDYLYSALYWNNVSHAFYWGYYSLAFLQQSDYDYYIVGSRRSDRWFSDLGTTWWSDDAIVPYWSEMNPYIVPTRRMPALGVNHEEATVHEEIRKGIKLVIQKPDIAIIKR